MAQLKFQFGPNAIEAYRRLSYTPWHAIAEFVDNSTQSYFDNSKILDDRYAEEKTGLIVRVAYDAEKGGTLRIFDNAMGMSLKELQAAIEVARPPANPVGRSKYGMGMKTAACWIGNKCVIRTKKLGETNENQITIDVKKISSGKFNLPIKTKKVKKQEHYTIIEITNHNHVFKGPTLGKIKSFLGSMYRKDIEKNLLALEFRGAKIEWQNLDDSLFKAADGTLFKKNFKFRVDGNDVHGWSVYWKRAAELKLAFLFYRRIV